jgi:hypothetical protein
MEKLAPTVRCDHSSTVTILIAGIRRAACERCGTVAIEYHHDFVLASAVAEGLVDAGLVSETPLDSPVPSDKMRHVRELVSV